MTEAEIRAVSPIAEVGPTIASASDGSGIIWCRTSSQQRRSQHWYSALLRDVGEREVRDPRTISYAKEIAVLEAKHRGNEFGSNREDNDRGFRRAAEALAGGRASSSAWDEARALAASHSEQFAAQRLRVLAALDAALAAMPLDGGFWFTRKVRNNVAELSEKEDGALDGMRAWRVRVEMPR